jgi:outer membrane protein OmpA-like peptidoglycan-associated protein
MNLCSHFHVFNIMRVIQLFILLIIGHSVAAQQLTPDPKLIKSIYFGGGSYRIDAQQINELKRFIESFPAIENYTISVHSHTDDIGSPEYNQMLSEFRGQMVIRELLENKVPEELISIQDFGEFNPVYDNNTYMGRLKNRRVDIILWPLNTL